MTQSNFPPKFDHNLRAEQSSLLDLPCQERRLHLGGTKRKDGWEVFNVQAGDHVDHIGDALDLTRFANDTFCELYAAHILEHFGYRHKLLVALHEWFRVVKPGGKIYISVPNLDVLAEMLLDKSITFSERFRVMRMMFGGQNNEYDFHYVGLNQDFLKHYLAQAGFRKIRRVTSFGIFKDTSNKCFLGRNISLNMTAIK